MRLLGVVSLEQTTAAAPPEWQGDRCPLAVYETQKPTSGIQIPNNQNPQAWKPSSHTGVTFHPQ